MWNNHREGSQKMNQPISHGLAMAEKHCTNYGWRARELKGEGKRIIGYLSALGPVEIITAAGAVPLRLRGFSSDPVTKADAHMETIVCPFVRNVFDAALKGRYSFLDGMVMPHLCDSIDRTSDVWRYNLRLPYWHFLNVPHLTDDSSMEFMKAMLHVLIGTLEKFTGKKVTDEDLHRAIKAHNENRAAMRELYGLRRSDPSAITGVEMMHVLIAAMSLPVEESTALIKSVTAEVSQRKLGSNLLPRIMISGGHIDNVALIETIEGSGAQVVMDDITLGSKVYWSDVDQCDDPVDGLAKRYLRNIKVPTTYTEEGDTYEASLEARFGHLKRFTDEFRIDGVILYVYKYCDPYGFDVPAIKSSVESWGVPVLYLEDEYSEATLPRIRTRVEAFTEMIAQ
jgi:bcr-type benzoyl-CoA reductase subunit C